MRAAKTGTVLLFQPRLPTASNHLPTVSCSTTNCLRTEYIPTNYPTNYPANRLRTASNLLRTDCFQPPRPPSSWKRGFRPCAELRVRKPLPIDLPFAGLLKTTKQNSGKTVSAQKRKQRKKFLTAPPAFRPARPPPGNGGMVAGNSHPGYLRWRKGHPAALIRVSNCRCRNVPPPVLLVSLMFWAHLALTHTCAHLKPR